MSNKRFQKWATIELRLYLADLKLKRQENTITKEESQDIQLISEEIERRTKIKEGQSN